MRIKPLGNRKRKPAKTRANRLLNQLKEQVDDGASEMGDAEIKSVKGSIKTNKLDTAKLDEDDYD